VKIPLNSEPFTHGTKRTFRDFRVESALGSKAEMTEGDVFLPRQRFVSRSLRSPPMRSTEKRRSRGRPAAMTNVPKPYSLRQLLAKIRQYMPK
jgi:hypothetical protein